MMRPITLAMPVAVVLLLATPRWPRRSRPKPAQGSAQHVSQCAQTLGFSDDRNLRMHRSS